MKLGQISQCEKWVNWSRNQHCLTDLPFSLAIFSRGVIQATHSTNILNIEYAHPTDAAGFLVKTMGSNWSFTDLAEWSWFSELTKLIPVSSLTEAMQLRDTPDLHRTMELMKNLSPEFLMSTRQKKWMPGDFEILKSLNADAFDFLNRQKWILKLSKSDSVRAFEWMAEIFLMGRQVYLPDMNSETAPLEILRKVRFPEATRQDDSRVEELQNISWPSSIRNHWVRRGDRAGFEVSFHVAQSGDLKKILVQLEQVQQRWAKAEPEHDSATH